ncbi:MAG: cell envelope integrity protein CreD [Lentisphaerae bacterium]|nr:cell envelope integrity protein CreD [Lentisphaerota bacterium]
MTYNNLGNSKIDTAWAQNVSGLMRNSFTAKVIMIGIVVLLCQIPILMVDDLIDRRLDLAQAVEKDIASKWGYRQKVSGPLLAIPVSRMITQTEKNGKSSREVTREEFSTYFAVPQDLKISGELTPEIRYRGIYEVVLYRSRIKLQGNIVFPAGVDKWQLQLDKSRLIVGIADLQGISAISGKFAGQTVIPEPGLCDKAPFPSGFSLPLGGQKNGSFEICFDLNGCRELLFSMTGRQTLLDLSSCWPAPSFCGAFLPVKRHITDKGFTAEWSVSEFNRDLPGSWIGSAVSFQQPEKNSHCGESHYERSAGVTLVKPADTYLQVNRAVEYALLVFIIVLMAMLIAERLTKVWVHPLQYFIAALSLVLFYSLTLAISEHTSFATAYIISTLVLAGTTGFYSALIYRKWRSALGMALAALSAYSAIFVILQLEDYALLAGTVILFVLLVVLMTFTGKINRMESANNSGNIE